MVRVEAHTSNYYIFHNTSIDTTVKTEERAKGSDKRIKFLLTIM